jgi:hypothetical protein
VSDLTSGQWAAGVLAKLRSIEATCSDEDLFCVAYLIPQVELLESLNENSLAPADEWQAVYGAYVEQSMTEDQMTGRDVDRIREILTQTA